MINNFKNNNSSTLELINKLSTNEKSHACYSIIDSIVSLPKITFLEQKKYKKIYDEMKKLYMNSTTVCLKKDTSECIDKLGPVIEDRKFLPDGFHEYLIVNKMDCSTTKISNVQINEYYLDNSNDKNCRQTNEIIRIINLVCSAYGVIFENMNLDLYIIYSDLKKKIVGINKNTAMKSKNLDNNNFVNKSQINNSDSKNKNFKYFTPTNINSGFAYGNIICIFRKEEHLKVLFHELTHHFNKDNHIHNVDDIIKEKFNTKKTNYFFECITELKAIILYSFYNSIKYNLDVNSVLEMELKFSLFQCAKIYDHQTKYYKSKYDELGINFPRKILIHQKTHVLEYYIIKCYLLSHLSLIHI
jgi:hypothetical protein